MDWGVMGGLVKVSMKNLHRFSKTTDQAFHKGGLTRSNQKLDGSQPCTPTHTKVLQSETRALNPQAGRQYDIFTQLEGIQHTPAVSTPVLFLVQ